MKNIHILPTDKPSRLVRNHTNKLLLTMQYLPLDKEIYCFPQNIYITSDEEIKNCYYFNSRDNAVRKNNNLNHPYHHKIILTDNKDLVKDGVQAIDDEFLEWFVKNPNCEEVEVKNPLIANVSDFGYKIIIPKEEPKQDLEKEMFELEQELDIPSHLRWHNSKPKQETTLEEVAERIYLSYENNDVLYGHSEELQLAYKAGIVDGAKWQQERMYSEEEVTILLQNIINEIEIRKQNIISKSEKMSVHLLEGGCMAFESSQDVVKEQIEQIEQFKNK